jgi:hypothetical protein
VHSSSAAAEAGHVSAQKCIVGELAFQKECQKHTSCHSSNLPKNTHSKVHTHSTPASSNADVDEGNWPCLPNRPPERHGRTGDNICTS